VVPINKAWTNLSCYEIVFIVVGNQSDDNCETSYVS